MNEETIWERLFGGAAEIGALVYLLLYGVITGVRDLIQPTS